MWLQHTPEFKLVISFTRNGEVTIKNINPIFRQTLPPISKSGMFGTPLDTLLKDQDKMYIALRNLGIHFSSAVSVMENSVVVSIAKADKGKFDEAVQNGKLEIPKTVKVNFIEGFSSDLMPDSIGMRVAPAAGVTGVPLLPSFQWGAVKDATSYHFQVAASPDFVSPLVDTTQKDSYFTLTARLKPGTTYYWRVQALFGNNAADYVSYSFTTAQSP